MSNGKNTEELLAAHGLTPLEYDALIGLDYRHFEPLDDLALYTVGELALARSFNPERTIATADTYREALRGLVEKGWLTVVTESPEARAAKLTAKGIHISPVDFLADIGCIDFTPQGYRRHRRLLKVKGFWSPETLVWTDDDKRTFSCIAGTKQACLAWLDELADPFHGGVSGWFYFPVRQIGVRGPERVGRWKPREAAPTYPDGWRVTVLVKRVRRRRFSLPDWHAEGWIEPEECLKIEGKIHGVHFSFLDGVGTLSHSQNPPIPLFQASLTIYDGKRCTGEPVFTTLNGMEALACTLGGFRGVHFHWEDAEHSERTKPLTIPEALVCLQEGFSAWKNAQANKSTS